MKIAYPKYFTFLKAQISSLISSAVDFLVTVMLTEFSSAWYLAASITGTVSGGITNFVLGRNWVFDARERAAGTQAVKYFIVWLGNLALNAGGVYLFTDIFNFRYWISKLLISFIVGIGYNYVFQRFFVFRK